jgi:hypothetical protein
VLTGCAAAVVSTLWIVAVPPFEGLDELYFYNRAIQFSQQPSASEPIFYRLASIVLRAVPRPPGPVEPRYNPAFSYTANRQGTVNRFQHERPVAPRGHVRALYALRAMVAALSIVTALCIYGIVRLTVDSRAAGLSAAVICLAIPQFSFMNATVHGEAVTRLYGAAVSLIVVAGLQRRLARPVMWIALVLLVAATPLIDRQGFFVVALASAGIVFAEPTWRRRAVVAAVLTLPVVALAWFVGQYNESGNLGPWFQLLRHPIRPLFYADPAFGSTDPPGARYYVFEFFPKLFLSFWAWLGQPSILLPPPTYAILAVVSIVGVAGAVLVIASGRTAPIEGRPDRLLALRILAFGVAVMCVPIAYGPALAGRNLWYGRWLFPMIGPIVMLLGVGWYAVLETAARRRRAAIALGAAGAVAAVLWIAAPGASFRAAIAANHYGDRPHLVLVARDTIVALLAAAAAFEWMGRRSWAAASARMLITPAAAAIALQVFVLTAIVWPRYAPLTADNYVGLIRRQLADAHVATAADTYAAAAQTYPKSIALRTLGSEYPRLLVGSRFDEMSGVLQQQLARGVRLDDRNTMLALAHQLRVSRAAAPDAIERAIADADDDPALAEPAALLRFVLQRADADPAAAARIIRAGAGRVIQTAMRSTEATLEGATVHTLPDGQIQVIVYYRPHTDWSNRQVWLHAYSDVAPETYLTPEPITIGSPMPKPGELDWNVWELPPGRYQAYVGIAVGTDVGPAYPIGALP